MFKEGSALASKLAHREARKNLGHTKKVSIISKYIISPITYLNRFKY